MLAKFKVVQPRATHNLLSIMRRFSVTRNAPELIRPSQPTPSGPLPLSAIDNRPYYDNYVQKLNVYRYGQEPAKVIKEALSKALVPYYPVAGTLRRSQSRDDGQQEVYCPDDGGGVLFIQASADCGLEDAGYSVCQPPMLIAREQLLPCQPTDVELHKPILSMQVTQFKCGGFIVGIKFPHAFFDGIGFTQFMNATAEISRGLLQPTIKPIWFREFILDPQQFNSNFTLPHLAQTSPAKDLEERVIDLSPNQINQLKDNYAKETGNKCSTFDILTALLWQLHTRAINVEPHTTVTLVFAVNMRATMNQVLPYSIGYYGNLVSTTTVRKTSGHVRQATFAEVVKMVRYAKQRSFTEPVEIDLPKLTLTVMDERNLGFYEIDYGWGAPTSIVPCPSSDQYIDVYKLFRSPVIRGGVRLWMSRVFSEHSEAFVNQLKTVFKTLS